MFTTAQKWKMIQALGKASIQCRDLGDYYISADFHIGGDGCLLGSYGNGSTPEMAVEDHFRIYTTLDHRLNYIVIGIGSDSPKYIWDEVAWKKIDDGQVNQIRRNSSSRHTTVRKFD